MRKIVGGVVEEAAGLARSVVPPTIRKRLDLQPLDRALHEVHFPSNDIDAAALVAFATPSHRTLIFEELFALQVGMMLRRVARKKIPGIAMPPAPKRVAEFFAALPFKPTKAQLRVIGEISADMAAPLADESPRPRRRRQRQDVGSIRRRAAGDGGRPSSRSDGADRAARRAALSQHGRVVGEPRRAHLVVDGQPPRRRRQGRARQARRRRHGPSSRHPRPRARDDRVRQARPRRHRRAAPLRRHAACRPPWRDDRHVDAHRDADSAHVVADAVWRSRRVVSRRDAAGAGASENYRVTAGTAGAAARAHGVADAWLGDSATSSIR